MNYFVPAVVVLGAILVLFSLNIYFNRLDKQRKKLFDEIAKPVGTGETEDERK